MPHPPRYKHDLFVSYGHVDNQVGAGEELGWVSNLVEDLKKRLSERLGRKDTFSVWRDQEDLQSHQDFEKQIASAVQSSACLLVILSPGYLASTWCQDELGGFLKWVRDLEDSDSRIFIVERDWIEAGKPDELQKLLGFKFWTGDPEDQSNLPRPLDKNRSSDRAEYNDQINRITHSLVSQLGRIRRESLKPPGLPPSVPSINGTVATTTPTASHPKFEATVFLAEVTDDLRPQWKKVCTELDQQGIRVVSAGTPRDAATTESAVSRLLEDSNLFVQLLSQIPGQLLPGGAETYAKLQHRLAKNAGKPILQWRMKSLTEEVFAEQEVEDPQIKQAHQELLFGQVRAEHIEDFKRHVVNVAKTSTKSSAPPVAGMMYVSYSPDSDDEKFGEDLCGYLEKRKITVSLPLNESEAKPDEIRADFERTVLGSQGWFVVYGAQRRKPWVRGQLSQINQLLCQHKIPSSFLHLCAGPPAPKDVGSALKLVGIAPPQMKLIDFQAGFKGEKLDPYVDEMIKAANSVADTDSGKRPIGPAAGVDSAKRPVEVSDGAADADSGKRPLQADRPHEASAP